MSARSGLGWSALPRAAQIYVAVVIAAGLAATVSFFPTDIPQPALFIAAVAASCLTSLWKVNLPIALASGSTLSLSYAANLMALLLLGPQQALLTAIAGVWTQCTHNAKEPYPAYRTIFSMSAEVLTMTATGIVYGALGGTIGAIDFNTLPRALLGAIATYFFLNTGLIAAVIAASTGHSFGRVWRQDFLWSGISYVVAGTAGACAAIVIARGQLWVAVLFLAPIYLTYRTYQVWIGREQDQTRHVVEIEQAMAREQAARASAEEANRLKDQFLAVVSHELRTPLNAVLGWSDMLRNGSIAEDRRGRAIQAIYDSAKLQAHLIEELLDIARIMAGKTQLDRAIVDLREIVRGAMAVVQPAAEDKRVRLTVSMDPSVGPFYGDGARLQQVVWNLLTNAIKFTPQNGAVHVNLKTVAGTIELSVADTGQGISEEFLPSVFEPFRQADASTTRRHGGLGLGLSIVKHFVEAHGGTIRATSTGTGHGSTFTVSLPLANRLADMEPDSLSPVRRPRRTSPESPTLSGVSVLVVDDDQQNREMIAAYLELHEAEVLMARSATEALDVLNRERVDVLLADIAMPDEDGYDLIRRVRSQPSPVAAIPAAAITAFARDEDCVKSLQSGFQLHLTKPVDPHALVDAVAKLAASTLTLTTDEAAAS